MKRSRIIIALVYSVCCALALTAQTKLTDLKKKDRHDFVPMGRHPNELKHGTYVVVATTLTKDDALALMKEYKRLKAPEPSYAYVSTKSLWYLHFDNEKDIEQAKQKRDELRKNGVYREAWLLTVHQ